MLSLIGTGLNPRQMTIEAIEAAKKADVVFVEVYTSRLGEGNTSELEKILGKKITPVGRGEMEENAEKLVELSKKQYVCILVIGNPLFATTHQQIVADAEKKGIKTQIVPGIGIFDYIGKTGLSPYKFGKTTSIVAWQENYKPESFYDAIISNLDNSCHTLCLLDIQKEKLMTHNEAIAELREIESNRKG